MQYIPRPDSTVHRPVITEHRTDSRFTQQTVEYVEETLKNTKQTVQYKEKTVKGIEKTVQYREQTLLYTEQTVQLRENTDIDIKQKAKHTRKKRKMIIIINN